MQVIASLVALLLLAAILVLVWVWRGKKEGTDQETNYRAYFIMGVSFIPAGAAMMIIFFLNDILFVTGLPLFALGVIYLFIGLGNRDKWKK